MCDSVMTGAPKKTKKHYFKMGDYYTSTISCMIMDVDP